MTRRLSLGSGQDHRGDLPWLREHREKTAFGWLLVIGGTLKAVYDLVLLVHFRAVVTREERVR